MVSHKRLHLRIRGQVQGVFYRVSARDEALRLGLAGWVRNCSDGSVELLAEGEEGQLKQLASWCMRGPPGAHVSRIEPTWSEATGEERGFRVTR